MDSGLCRKLVYDARTGLSHLETVRISQDMATQRRGRAGRITSGVCYRLWTQTSEHLMPEQRLPEILDADLSSMVLDIAAFGETNRNCCLGSPFLPRATSYWHSNFLCRSTPSRQIMMLTLSVAASPQKAAEWLNFLVIRALPR